MSWTKRERMEAVLHGEVPDRPPVTAYRHFPAEENEAASFAKSMVDFHRQYDWDWLKINSNAVYYYEAWGNTYDKNDYTNNVPRRTDIGVHDPSELSRIVELSGDYGPFKMQLDAIKLIREAVGPEEPVYQSIFSPIAVLQNVCGDRSPGRYREFFRSDCKLLPLFKDHAEETHRALKAIANTLADYASKCIEYGADGIFYAEMGMAREGYLTREEFKEFIEPYDRIVLDAVAGKPRMFHTCGMYGNPELFADFPIEGLHWAQSAPGNAPLKGSHEWLGKIAAMGGVDERMFGLNNEKKDDIARMARESVIAEKGHPFMLTPECTVDIKTTDEELRALRSAVEEA